MVERPSRGIGTLIYARRQKGARSRNRASVLKGGDRSGNERQPHPMMIDQIGKAQPLSPQQREITVHLAPLIGRGIWGRENVISNPIG
jgi:hypothetical protein